MGGKVGLKGTDGHDVLLKARALGAEPESPGKAIAALKVISQIRDEIELITYPREMGETVEGVVVKLMADQSYPPMFARAYGTPEINWERVGLALEQFLLTRISQDSRFDRAMRREITLTAEERRGLYLFVTENDLAKQLVRTVAVGGFTRQVKTYLIAAFAQSARMQPVQSYQSGGLLLEWLLERLDTEHNVVNSRSALDPAKLAARHWECDHRRSD